MSDDTQYMNVPKPSRPDQGCSPSEAETASLLYADIFEAVQANDIDAVRGFLSRGVDVNQKDDTGGIPLHWAASNGHRGAAELLLSRGAHMGARTREGNASIHMAALEGHRDVVELLLSRGARPDEKGENDWTPLHFAANGGHKEVVELLLSRGADLRALTVQGSQPIHWAASEGHGDVVELLLSKGAGVDEKGENDWTPLHFSASNGQREVAELLLSRGADPRAQTSHGRTPIHWASSEGHKELADFLASRTVPEKPAPEATVPSPTVEELFEAREPVEEPVFTLPFGTTPPEECEAPAVVVPIRRASPVPPPRGNKYRIFAPLAILACTLLLIGFLAARPFLKASGSSEVKAPQLPQALATDPPMEKPVTNEHSTPLKPSSHVPSVSVTPAPGFLRITSNVSPANTYLDGKYVGKTDLSCAGIKVGAHRLKISKEGFVTWEKKVSVKSGQEIEVAANLTRIYVAPVRQSPAPEAPSYRRYSPPPPPAPSYRQPQRRASSPAPKAAPPRELPVGELH